MLSIFKNLKWLPAVLITLVASQALAHGMSDAEKQIIAEGGNLRYIWIGATHMLTGFDHLAFVFGIIFFLTKFRDVVKYITAFTVGHSITLIFATFNAIQVNYFLIDAVIALSVCYIAFHNFDGFKKYLKIDPPNMLAMIFGLGLIHGLGLSTRLQQLPLNVDNLLMNIISFNIGIELGQIAALAVMLVLITAFRKSHFFPTFSKISNSFLILVGAFLFIVQMHGYEHAANSGEYAVTAKTAGQSGKNLDSTQNPDWKDTVTVTIPARGDKEYKLQLAKDATFEYSWQTDRGKLFFDLHGEPKGGSAGEFKSFQKSTEDRSEGSLTAVFEGTHGWYWKNNNSHPVNITLNIKGEYQRLDTDSRQTDAAQTPNASSNDTRDHGHSHAQGDHGHSHAQKAVSSEEAVSRASEIVTKLADAKMIDISWVGIKADSIEQKTFSRDPEWVITFKNDKIEEPTQRTLYVFFSLGGEYISANYTGN